MEGVIPTDMPVITHNDVPAAVSSVLYELRVIKGILQKKGADKELVQDRWFSIDEVCNYIPGKPSRATIYSKVHTREIPHKKLGKRLAFLQSEIDHWLQSKTRKTHSEIEAEADVYLHGKRKK